MRKLLTIFIVLGMCGSLYASKNGWFTGRNAYPYRVAVASGTSTTLFTNDGEIESVQYDNRTGYDIVLTTFAITTTLAAPTTAYTYRRILQSGKWPPFKMENTNYRFAISTGGIIVPVEFYIDINK
jgi:hypothetical protein